jgi:hypothetical protein
MDVEAQIEGFIAKFSDELAPHIRAIRASMRARLPEAFELVYDNYQALAIGYGLTERPSEAVFSIACFPKRTSLVFTRGVDLDDPKGILNGQGNQVRHIPIHDLAILDDPDVRALWDQALAKAVRPAAPVEPRTIVKSVSAKQRPRRP